MWRCSKCGEEHEDAFDACWNCGTEKNDRAPEQVEPEEETPIPAGLDLAPLNVQLVRRGRTMLLVLIAADVIYDLISAIMTWPSVTAWRKEEIIGFVCACILWYGLWYAVWCGRFWAITLMRIFAAIGVICGFMMLVDKSNLAILPPLVLCGVTLACLTMSKSINEFLRHQRQAEHTQSEPPNNG